MSNLIKKHMDKLIEHGTKAKFYRGNIDLFLQYFDSKEQYEAMIAAGNFDKMEKIVKEGAQGAFGFERFFNN